MKMKKIMIMFVAVFGLYAGSASALTIQLSLTDPQASAVGASGMGAAVGVVSNGVSSSGGLGNGLDSIGPGETDTSKSSGVLGVTSAVDFVGWWGLEAINNVFTTITAEMSEISGNLLPPGYASSKLPLAMELYLVTGANQVDEANAAASTVYDVLLKDSASAGTSLTRSLAAGTSWLVKVFGTTPVPASGEFNFTYNATAISSVPVPAAVWLFGTAMLGLFGFKRKGKKTAGLTA